MSRKSISRALLFSLTAASGHATTLSNLEGAVFVNSGGGFEPAAAGMALSPAGRVRTTLGSADIVYDNGCSTRLQPDQTAIVFSSAPVCGKSVGPKGEPAAAGQTSPDYLTVAGILAFDAGVAVGAIAGNNNSGFSATTDAITSPVGTRPASP